MAYRLFRSVDTYIPSNDYDVATKAYVDGVAQGLDVKKSVIAASTASFTMASTASATTLVLADDEGGFDADANTFTQDAISLAAGARVLIKDGVNSNSAGVSTKWNGIYTVGSLTGSTLTLTRGTDTDTAGDLTSGSFTFVEKGSSNSDTGWVMTQDAAITMGTTLLPWAQFSGAGAVSAGTGLSRTGTELSVDASQAQITTVGALVAGSIASGFGAIDNGTDNVTSGGIWKVDVDASGTGAGLAGTAGTLNLGANNDLNIYHDSANSYIVHNNTGDLVVETTNGGIILDTEDDTLEIKYSGTVGATFDGDGLDLASGDAYLINNTSVLNASTLGSGVTASSLTSVGTLSALTVDDVNVNGKVITMTGDTSDTVTMTAAAAALFTIATTDDAGADGHIVLDADGDVKLDALTGITRFMLAGDADDLCTLTVAASGVTTLATADSDGTSGHLTLDVDGNITLDADGGTITFSDDGSSFGTITSAGWTGAVVGNASSATVSTTVTITDNEDSNEENAIIFGAGGDVDGGNLGLESDGHLVYNPSAGRLSVPAIASANVTGNLTGTASKATVTDSTANTDFPVVFNNESDGLLDDTAAFEYNPSTGTLIVANLDIGTNVDIDGNLETDTLSINGTTVTTTAAELNLIDGVTISSLDTTDDITGSDGMLVNDGGTMRLCAIGNIVKVGLPVAVTKTSAATLAHDGSEGLILCDPSGGAFTITLSSASVGVRSGWNYIIKNHTTSTNAITIATAGSEKIDDQDTLVLDTPRAAVRLYSDGSHWHVV